MSPNSRITNSEIIPYALYELGGIGRFVDIEDMFMRCYELAPERFKWRKYEIPNYKAISQAMRNIEERYPDIMIRTNDGISRQLTSEGVKWVERRLARFKKLLSETHRAPSSRRPSQRPLTEVSNNPIFIAYQNSSKIDASKFDIADLLVCSPDSPASIWNQRIETLMSAAEASNRSDIVSFLEALRSTKSQWFGEGENGY